MDIIIYPCQDWRSVMLGNGPLVWFAIDQFYDDVIKRKHFPRYWPFVREIHRSPLDSHNKGQWRRDGFFDLHQNKRLNKQSRRRLIETQSRSLWRHCNTTHSLRDYFARIDVTWGSRCLISPADPLFTMNRMVTHKKVGLMDWWTNGQWCQKCVLVTMPSCIRIWRKILVVLILLIKRMILCFDNA